MACTFEYKGKTYTQDELVKELEKMPPDEASKYIPGVKSLPNAPFKKTWHELVLKRMIREAAEKGYDRLSWTPGEAQAERYNLSKQVDKLQYNPDTQKLLAYKDKNLALDQYVPKEKLADYIGKEAAKKILENPTHKFESKNDPGTFNYYLEGLDLKVGGEGMKGFYDQIIPKALEKIGKEYGVKVKNAGINETNYKLNIHEAPGGATIYEVINSNTGEKHYYPTFKEANKLINSGKSQPVHYIDIPEGLKNAALSKGFPLFSSSHPGIMFTPTSDNPFEDKSK